jgi:hypothetical protein
VLLSAGQRPPIVHIDAAHAAAHVRLHPGGLRCAAAPRDVPDGARGRDLHDERLPAGR